MRARPAAPTRRPIPTSWRRVPAIRTAAGGRGAGRAEPEPSLPEAVRQRIVSLTAAVLPGLPADEVPVPLRRVAKFAPNRRARLGAPAIAAQLAADPLFRQRVTARVLADAGDLGAAVVEGTAPAAADPVEVAALAYLARPRGWRDLIDASGAAVRAEADSAVVAELVREAEQRATRAEHDRAVARVEADKLRDELARVREELGQLREESPAADPCPAGDAGPRAQDERAAGHRAGAGGPRRRGRGRRAAPDPRPAGRGGGGRRASPGPARRRPARSTTRGCGCSWRPSARRPSGCAANWRWTRWTGCPPTSSRRPSPTATTATAAGAATRARDTDDPARLDQLLALPRAHLVVDGYNVTKRGFGEMSLEQQRKRLITGLGGIAAQTGDEVTVVFDGAERIHGLPPTPRGVRVLFSRKGETADELIRRLVRAEPPGRPVVVVSSDREVADGVRRHGAYPLGADSLLRRLSRS